jgi:hypothetical protein
VAEIERKIIEQGKKNPVSRFFHAKSDKEMIATWKSDLNRILHVFTVCSLSEFFGSRQLLHLQTELAVTTHIVVTDTHLKVTDTQVVVEHTHTTVTETKIVAEDTHTMVADIHRTVLAGRGTDSKHLSVSTTFCLTCFN